MVILHGSTVSNMLLCPLTTAELLRESGTFGDGGNAQLPPSLLLKEGRRGQFQLKVIGACLAAH